MPSPTSQHLHGKKSDGKTLHYMELLRFFLPLGITPMMFAMTHSIVLAALARLPFPEANLAAYTVVQGLTNAMKAPTLASRQTTASLIQDRKSYRAVMRLLWMICAFFTMCMTVIGFSPIGEIILTRFIGIQDEKQLFFALIGLRIVVFLPFVETLRNGLQGIAIGTKATGVLPLSTATRVALTFLFAGWAVSTHKLSGIVVGTGAWVVGIGLEGVLVGGYLIYRFGSLSRAAHYMPRSDRGTVTPGGFMKFFIPLGIMMVVAASMPPVIQSGLARGPSPTETLAAFGVAWSLVTILSGPLQMLHHAPLVYVKALHHPTLHQVRLFCLAVGAVVSSLVLIVGVTPVGDWLAGSVMGISEDMIPLVLQTCTAFSVFPLIASWRETYWGLLMQQRQTGLIGQGRITNLATVLLAVLFLFQTLIGGLHLSPPVAAALIYTLGEAVEAVVVSRQARVRLAAAGTPSYSTTPAQGD